jgi:GNAT superfamily N-acetyltransferase
MPTESCLKVDNQELTLTFETLSLDDFSAKRSRRDNRYFFRSGPEGIKYYMNPGWSESRDDYTFFVCTGSPREETFHGEDINGNAVTYTETITPVLGIAELQINPYDRSIVWLKYVSVAAGFHGNGIGRRLACDLAAFVKESGLQLSRSSSNDLAKERGFQAMMHKVLDGAGVPWTQTNY